MQMCGRPGCCRLSKAPIRHWPSFLCLSRCALWELQAAETLGSDSQIHNYPEGEILCSLTASGLYTMLFQPIMSNRSSLPCALLYLLCCGVSNDLLEA